MAKMKIKTVITPNAGVYVEKLNHTGLLVGI